jgi:hypothetical protein
MYYTYDYIIDFDKIESIEDIKVILKAIEWRFNPDHPMIVSNELMPYMKKQNKVKP